MTAQECRRREAALAGGQPTSDDVDRSPARVIDQFAPTPEASRCALQVLVSVAQVP